MARILGLLPAMLTAAREGMSANAFNRAQQEVGYGARRTEVLQLFKIAKSIVTAAPEEPFADQTLAPSQSELQSWPTKKATGIRQNVTITYRDKETGDIKQTFWSVISNQPITREEATSRAIGAYAEHAERYKQALIGAVHTGAYNLVPFPGAL